MNIWGKGTVDRGEGGAGKNDFECTEQGKRGHPLYRQFLLHYNEVKLY